MTNWLKWRLCALLGTSALISGATYLHAQDDYPAPAKTPEEAGTQFYQFLRAGRTQGAAEGIGFDWTYAAIYKGAISREQMQQISPTPTSHTEVFTVLAEEAAEPQYSGRVTGTSNNQTIVEVTPSERPINRAVVVVAEDGGYRVDLKATFARWNNLSGQKLDEKWFDLTGIVAPTMTQNADFLRSRCQSQLRQQMLGMMQYVQDYDERFPPPRQWIDGLQPYTKSEQIFKCPALPKGGNGYAYNQNLNHVSVASIESLSSTIGVYETSNPRRNWFGPGTGRAYRHLNGWNLGFADGHVKWFSSTGSASSQIRFKP